MKIQALFSNGKYWQKKAQFKNSKKQNKHKAKIGKDWQRLAKIGKDWQRLAKIGKDWQNVGQANCGKSGIKFTLAFSGKYCHKKSDKMRVRKPYGKKWQNAAQANYGNEWYKL